MKHLLVVLGLVFSGPAAATRVDQQIWLQTVVTVPVSGPVSVFGGMYLRYSDGASELGTRYLLGGLEFDLGRDVELGIGYANLKNRSGDVFNYESRLFQQLSYPIVEGRLASIEGRTRLEQRFFSEGGGSKLRLRQRAEILVPLGGDTAPLFKTTGELFTTLIGTNDVSDVEFDQLRGFVGLEVPVGRLTFDIGYLGQRREAPARRNDVLFVGMDVDF
jgi:hypothetical protein